MSWLTDFLVRPRPKHAADVVIARRIESDRAKAASAHKARAEHLAALSHAATLGRLPEPMRPRDEVVADVRRARDARKNSPVPGGADTETMRLATPFALEGTRGRCSSPDNRASELPPAGLFALQTERN